jgi:hypothetical protein
MSLDGEKLMLLKSVRGLSFLRTKPSYKRLYRWARTGVGGIKLETYREGGRIYTSIEAVKRFVDKTNSRS